ncbi:tRNAIle-lysidine synthase [Hondaea fermentalgiana]|uniref:tRNA(Ile)-lysidine synthetase n=1 Tax=Hondaea fermentalgiana TaxID=2315210 RepID=A0A2R5GWJ5_9STRA|nr:tRNAIle-lysidine synthase [Hondaea fermentalgiana]|eukprot:GBG34138.1 tRNAIle-lysidine synthase [Hondaea fermentalgiana]
MLALVVVLDQVSRHLLRGHEEEIDACTREAVRYARVAFDRGLDRHLRAAEFCFLALPLRHFLKRMPTDPACTEIRDLLKAKGDERQDDEAAHMTALERFDTATAASDVLGSSAPRDGISDADILEEPEMVDQVETCLDEDRLALIAKDRVFALVSGFLDERVNEGDDLFISLSGGVDSMVIAACLAAYARLPRGFALRARKKRRVDDADAQLAKPRHRVVAVHIDYGNRPESGAEADLVKRWCLAHGITCEVTAITAVRRGVTPRDEYEKKSRAMRYDAYRRAMEGHNDGRAAIMFGHHQGDVQENVVSNAMKGASVLDLSGMTPESTVEGVRVWRPLLSLNKGGIYTFARKYGVPWFKDTTPRWSTRGKLRNRLWPALGLVYGAGFGSSLSSLAAQSDEVNAMLRSEIFEPFWNSITFGRLGAWIPLTTPGLLDRPFFFWRYALRHVCHHLQAGAIREQPIARLTDLLRSRKFRGKNQQDKCRWLELRFQNPSLLYDEGSALCIFRELPDAPARESALQEDGFWQLYSRKHGEKDAGLLSLLPDGKSHLFGPFRVSVERASEAGAPDSSFDLRAWMMNGHLRYTLPFSASYVPCPQYGRKIDFFRGADRKLRAMLPIVINADALENGSDKSTTATRGDASDGFVHVKIELATSS